MSNKKEFFEWIYCIIIAIVLALLIRYFVGTPTIVKQPSMFPTLKENQRLWLNKWAIRTKQDFERGEIVTFEAPLEKYTYIPVKDADLENPIAIYESDENKGIFKKFVYYVLEIGKKSYIKRVIGLPGEHVEIKDGCVYVNGEKLDESYLQDGVITTDLEGAFTDIIVPDGYLFLMGDNRSHSTDSRRFGCIPINKIESKVYIRIWPLNLWGKVD